MPVALPAALLSVPIAHRALHDWQKRRPENSPAAIKAAIAAGYGIELDLQLSSDGVAMVFHDDELYRLTSETGRVRAQTAETLGQIKLRFSEDGIPTLAQVLALVAGRVALLIEIKDQSLTMTETDGRLEAATVAALAGYNGPVALMSFNPFAVAHLARLAPHLPRGLITSGFDPDGWSPLPTATCDTLRGIPDYDRTGASFISHEAGDLDRPRVADLKAQGAAVLCWTIRSAETEAKARTIAQNITFEGYAAALPA